MPKSPSDRQLEPQSSHELSLTRVWNIFARRPWPSVGGPLALAFAAGMYFYAYGSYTTRSRFTPQQQQSNLSSLAGLASQFGLSGITPSLTGGQSVAFYEELLKSPQLLARLGETQYVFAVEDRADSIHGDLYQLYGIEGATKDKRTANMVDRLMTRIAVTTNVRASLVSVTVKAPFPELSKKINRRILELVSEFNLRTLQTIASEERMFAEQRMAAAREELLAAERSMQGFLERNRTYQSSPELVFAAARIQRRLDLQQQVYVTLSQSYEQARVAEVRSTPIITIVDPPELTATRSRNPVAMAFVALIAGLVSAVALGLALDMLEQWRGRRLP